jgi:hypothetical protein
VVSRYTLEAQKVFKAFKPPYPNFVVDVVEYDKMNTLALRVYRPNVEEFSQGQKVALAEYLYKLRDAMRDVGVRVFIEGVESDPPKR